jgi:hypothetical protein
MPMSHHNPRIRHHYPLCPQCGVAANEAHYTGALHRNYGQIQMMLEDAWSPAMMAQALNITPARMGKILKLFKSKEKP